MSTEVISSQAFYGEYHGHKLKHLKILYPRLRAQSNGLIWTAGDSSLDNKYWFGDHRPAISGAYADTLRPPVSICDVTYWLNHESFEKFGISRWSAINTAIEATTLNQRTYRDLPQDKFIRENITEDDVLIVSIGGNDIALSPTPCTIASMAGLICLPKRILQLGRTSCTVPFQDCCCGCGASTMSCFGSFPPCLGYFSHLWGTRVKKYIESLISKRKPKKVLVCMIYYLDEALTPSWASPALGALGYNRDPEKLQLLIRKMFEEATAKISIPGTEIVPVPLYHVLDGKNTQDYVARVEPSAQGGKKMAEYLLDTIEGKTGSYYLYQSPCSNATTSIPPLHIKR